MPSLCVFSKQDDALVGWPDAISTDPLMNLETYEASFSVQLNQALNAHIARVVEDLMSNLEASERRYYAGCRPQVPGDRWSRLGRLVG